ncbi:MAG: polysaccharide deacetylase, partial [Clostridiales bacterium]|nr:polysaccharide deacetylase [Clostridiales bacterium]
MFARTRAFLSSIILFLLGLILIFALVYWIRIFLNQQNSDIPIYKVDTNKNEILYNNKINFI